MRGSRKCSKGGQRDDFICRGVFKTSQGEFKKLKFSTRGGGGSVQPPPPAPLDPRMINELRFCIFTPSDVHMIIQFKHVLVTIFGYKSDSGLETKW